MKKKKNNYSQSLFDEIIFPCCHILPHPCDIFAPHILTGVDFNIVNHSLPRVFQIFLALFIFFLLLFFVLIILLYLFNLILLLLLPLLQCLLSFYFFFIFALSLVHKLFINLLLSSLIIQFNCTHQFQFFTSIITFLFVCSKYIILIQMTLKWISLFLTVKIWKILLIWHLRSFCWKVLILRILLFFNYLLSFWLVCIESKFH